MGDGRYISIDCYIKCESDCPGRKEQATLGQEVVTTPELDGLVRACLFQLSPKGMCVYSKY